MGGVHAAPSGRMPPSLSNEEAAMADEIRKVDSRQEIASASLAATDASRRRIIQAAGAVGLADRKSVV